MQADSTQISFLFSSGDLFGKKQQQHCLSHRNLLCFSLCQFSWCVQALNFSTVRQSQRAWGTDQKLGHFSNRRKSQPWREQNFLPKFERLLLKGELRIKSQTSSTMQLISIHSRQSRLLKTYGLKFRTLFKRFSLILQCFSSPALSWDLDLHKMWGILTYNMMDPFF